MRRSPSSRRFGPCWFRSAAGESTNEIDSNAAWGNVRELERVIERAVALATSDAIGLEDLPPSMLAGHGDALLTAVRDNDSMRAWGCRYARLVLERCANNKRRACRELGISYHTLQAYLRFRGDKPRRSAPTRS